MYLKRVKRKCSIRGCKNTDCFAISRTREVGNTVIACKECLEQALDGIKNIPAEAKSNIPKSGDPVIPPLFFNAEITAEEFGENTASEASEDSSNKSAGSFACERCGKVFESEKGLKAHKRFCTGGEISETEKHI